METSGETAGGLCDFLQSVNLARALKRDGSPLRRRRIGYQLAGMAAMIWTAAKMTPYILRLLTGRPSYRTDAKETTIEMRQPDNAFRRCPTTSIKKAKRMLTFVSQTVSPPRVSADKRL